MAFPALLFITAFVDTKMLPIILKKFIKVEKSFVSVQDEGRQEVEDTNPHLPREITVLPPKGQAI
jgi:hypothetical protein